MTPVLVTAATVDPITAAEAKAHLRVSHSEDDVQIGALIKAATAYLDGRTGILGRCIMEQTWAVEVETPGCVVLPLPDVTEATAAYADGNTPLTVKATARGPVVEVTEGCEVQFTCAMPAHLLPVAQDAVRIWVQMRYDGLSGYEAEAFQATFDSLVAAIRWRQV